MMCAGMQKKYLYSLLTTYMATLGALSSCCSRHVPDEKIPQKPKKVYVYKPRELKTRVDTVNVTDENFDNIKKTAAGGLFFVASNTIVLHYFNSLSDSSRIINFCNLNNSMHPLFLRHEKEHARKQDLVYSTTAFSKFACGQISVADEVSARVAEIIEAVDYHTSTGYQLPRKRFVARADSVIGEVAGVYLPGRINYNYRPVADAVITYALEGFLDAYNRGFYKKNICIAYNRKGYKKTSFMTATSMFAFNPDINRWDPMWDFESRAGECNPYQNASFSVRQRLMQVIDSVVCDATDADNFNMFYINSISR